MAKKRAYWVIAVLSILSVLSGTSHLMEGIQLRGFGGVNYGVVGFPALAAGWAMHRLRLLKYREA